MLWKSWSQGTTTEGCLAYFLIIFTCVAKTFSRTMSCNEPTDIESHLNHWYSTTGTAIWKVMLLSFNIILMRVCQNIGGSSVILGVKYLGIRVLGFDSQLGPGNFLFIAASRTPEAHPASYPMGTGGPFRDHSPQFSAQVKNAWSYTSTPPISLHCLVLS